MQTKKGILVVSFGTSYASEQTIGAIEEEIAKAFPEYVVRRAFTSKMILKKLKERDGIHIDTVQEAMERFVADGFETVICQPTHVMPGIEYEKMLKDIAPFTTKFKTILYGKPLLHTSEDFNKVVTAITTEGEKLSEQELLLLVGHGTTHFADTSYAALDYRFQAKGHDNIIIGTVEGYPDQEVVLQRVREKNPSKVLLAPLMIVVGDHAYNDICGKEAGSWQAEIEQLGYPTKSILKGLGEYASIRKIFIEHIQETLQIVGD